MFFFQFLLTFGPNFAVNIHQYIDVPPRVDSLPILPPADKLKTPPLSIFISSHIDRCWSRLNWLRISRWNKQSCNLKMGIIKVNKRVQRQRCTLADDVDLLLKRGTEAPRVSLWKVLCRRGESCEAELLKSGVVRRTRAWISIRSRIIGLNFSCHIDLLSPFSWWCSQQHHLPPPSHSLPPPFTWSQPCRSVFFLKTKLFLCMLGLSNTCKHHFRSLKMEKVKAFQTQTHSQHLS